MRKGATALIILLAGLCVPAASAQTPLLPTGEVGGVAIKQSGRNVTVTFGREAAQTYKVVAGRRVDVQCTTLSEPRRAGMTVQESETKRVRAPERRRPIRVRLASGSGSDYCLVARSRFSRRKDNRVKTYPSRRVASVPLTQRGATFLDERRKTAELTRVASLADILAIDDFNSRYPPAPQLVRHIPRTVALTSPEASPTPGRVGIYTANGRDLTVATLSATGKRLYIEIVGDRFSTNVAEQFFTY